MQNVVLLVLLYVVSKESLKRIATAVGVYAVLVAVLASGAFAHAVTGGDQALIPVHRCSGRVCELGSPL